MLLVCWAADSATFTNPGAPSIASSPSQSWTQDVWDNVATGSPSVDSQAGIWHAVLVGASPGSSTVSVTNGATGTAVDGAALRVLVLTGHDPTSPVGAFGGNRQDGGNTITQNYTAEITGGQGFMVVSDWNAGDTSSWAPASGCTIIDRGTITGEISYAFLERTAADDVLSGTTTMGLTGLPAGGQYHWGYVEVISTAAVEAAAAAAGYPAFGASPPMF